MTLGINDSDSGFIYTLQTFLYDHILCIILSSFQMLVYITIYPISYELKIIVVREKNSKIQNHGCLLASSRVNTSL